MLARSFLKKSLNFLKFQKMNVYKVDHIKKSKIIITLVNEKINNSEQFSPKYYEEVLSILPKTNYDLVQFRKEIFKKALEE
jgi:hypothetical protein